jgi:hypothetical protein
MIKLMLFIALFFYSKWLFAVALLIYFFYALGTLDKDNKEITIGDLDDDMDCY